MKESPKQKAKHKDAKQDKKLFGKMMKKEMPKMKKEMKHSKEDLKSAAKHMKAHGG